MDFPLRIVFRHLSSRPDLEALIREEARRLRRCSGRILYCRVTVDLPHRHHRKGNHYRTQVALALPGLELVAVNGTDSQPDGGEIQASISSAFRAARSRLYAWRTRWVAERSQEPSLRLVKTS